MMYTVYEFPEVITILNKRWFPDALGVYKIPPCDQTPWLYLIMVLQKDDKFQIAPVAQTIYDSIKTPIESTTRAVIIDILKIAIKNYTRSTNIVYTMINTNVLSKKHAQHTYVLLRAEIYLEELIMAEAEERCMRHAISKIEEAYINAITIPTHPWCQNRLLREFREFTEAF